MNLPNLLTLMRIFLIPVLIIVFYLPSSYAPLASAVVFAVAGITDWFDGYLARKWNQTTAFGAFLDPVADKLMVSTALLLLVEFHHTPLLTIPATVIVGREIVISALREWMAELGKRASVAVSYIGKVKTALQMIAITILLSLSPDSPSFIYPVGMVMLYISSALTIWSMVVYLRAAWIELKPAAEGK